MELTEIINKFQLLNEHILLKRLVIIVLYGVFAKGVDLFIDRVLRKLATKTKISFDDHLITFIHTPICWTVFLLGILHALVLQELQMPWQLMLPSLTKSAIMLVWLSAFLRIFHLQADKNLANILSRGKIGKDLFYLLKNIVRVLLVVACLLWLLSIWDVDLTPIFASAGIAGIAVALAAKDTLANFFGGISIFADNTFKVGDYIILDSAERGEVVEIGIRSTRIKTRDDVLITIPNSILANSKIINESAPMPRFRIRIPVGVSYGSDLSRVEDALLEVAAGNHKVITEPAPRVRLRSFGDSSVNFELLLWVEDPRVKGLETHNLLRQIYEKFNREGIVIPFPQRDVHIKETEARSQESE